MTKTRKDKRLSPSEFFKHIAWGGGLVIVFVLGIGSLVYLKFASYPLGKDEGFRDVLGTFGDFIGGIMNPVVSACAFAGLLYTIWMQQRASKEQQEQMVRQSFESTFFQLLRLFDVGIERMAGPKIGAGRRRRGMPVLDAFKERMSGEFTIKPPTHRNDLAREFATAASLTGSSIQSYLKAFDNMLSFIASADECVDKLTFTKLFMAQLSNSEKYVLLIWVGLQPKNSHIKSVATQLGIFREPWVRVTHLEEFVAAAQLEEKAFGGKRPFRPVDDISDQDD